MCGLRILSAAQLYTIKCEQLTGNNVKGNCGFICGISLSLAWREEGKHQSGYQVSWQDLSLGLPE
jgi:hypothetical protein